MKTNYLPEITSLFKSFAVKKKKVVRSKDILIPLITKYWKQEDCEDILLSEFFKENIISKSTFSEIITDLENLPDINFSVILREGQNVPALILDPEASNIMNQAEIESQIYPQSVPNTIYTSHIFMAALKVSQNFQEIFEDQGIGYYHISKFYNDHKKLFDNMNKLMDDLFSKKKSNPSKPKPPMDNDNDDNEEDWMEGAGFPFFQKEEESNSMLSKYARQLGNDEGDTIIGRQNELYQLLEILGCKKKNNAILIGEAGVGKTAIVELLAQKIKAGDVPGEFKNKKIYSLDLNSLVAGTKYRGQYEERLKGIIDEVTQNPDIIIYIDEIHNLVGNGNSTGSGDAANILKPYLARGTFQCIGSTTFSEYRKFIEKDSALKRRFQNVRVEEPSKEETLEILKGTKKTYEKYHKVSYSKEILEACIDLSERYIHDRHFPDKAVDSLDLAGSLARLRVSTDEENSEIKVLLETLKEIQKEKNNSVQNLDWDNLGSLKEKENQCKSEIKRLEKKGNKTIQVSMKDVEEAVGKRSGIPLDSIGKSDLDKLRQLNTTLKSEVIGQEEAIKEVVLSLQRNSLGLRDPKKPIANLLFVGNTGTGKTLLCKKLAKEFFGSEDMLIRYDMNEYTDKTGVSKLLGSNPGYVGYDQESGFESVRKHPYSVILIDEIEKSTTEVFQLFLNIMDEGKVTLNNGVEVNFKNTIIIFTGNVGTKNLDLYGNGIGYQDQGLTEERKNQIIQKSLEKTFSPEFRNRLTKTIIFNNLGKEELKQIVNLEIKKLQDRLKKSKVKIKVSEEIKDKILNSCNLKFGGRDIARNVIRFIEEPLCDYLLETTDNWKKKRILVDLEEDKVKLSV